MLTLMTSIAAVDSATNITSCTSVTNDECLQNLTSCLQPPCLLSCGWTSPQQTCFQECVTSRRSNLSEIYQCDAVECQALQFCSQTCYRINCKSLTCTAKDCNQECLRTSCGKMVCHKNATNCTQAVYHAKNAQIMECNAKSCDQDYTLSSKTFSSELTCFSAVESCTQKAKSGKFNLKCLSGVRTCTQRVKTFSSTNMQCDGDSCEQTCSTYSTCNMSCSASVKECTQFEEWSGASVVTMTCDADVCTQTCNSGQCNMTCTSNVKNCTQICKRGTCSTMCNAEICLRDFGISTTAGSTSYPSTYPTVSSKSSGNFVAFCLVLISLVISTSTNQYLHFRSLWPRLILLDLAFRVLFHQFRKIFDQIKAEQSVATESDQQVQSNAAVFTVNIPKLRRRDSKS